MEDQTVPDNFIKSEDLLCTRGAAQLMPNFTTDPSANEFMVSLVDLSSINMMFLGSNAQLLSNVELFTAQPATILIVA
jgi:hypothetical protein